MSEWRECGTGGRGARRTSEFAGAEDPVGAALDSCGRAPLPPYIGRSGDEDPALDRGHYQTVFAREAGAVAAPTAGLHFTPALLGRLDEVGVRRAAVTLHVGEGTFAPVRTEHLEDHRMHCERYALGPEVAEAVAATRQRGGRLFAVGTTSTRTLETCAVGGAGRLVAPGSGTTDIFLHPANPPKVVDGLLTNFHLPALVADLALVAVLPRARAYPRDLSVRGRS